MTATYRRFVGSDAGVSDHAAFVDVIGAKKDAAAQTTTGRGSASPPPKTGPAPPRHARDTYVTLDSTLSYIQASVCDFLCLCLCVCVCVSVSVCLCRSEAD